MEFVTMGETMAAFSPSGSEKLRNAFEYQVRIAGAESNCAVGICRMGHTAAWISRVGKDGLGEFVVKNIRAEGVDVSCVETDERRHTGVMFKETVTGNETKVTYYRKDSAASQMYLSETGKSLICNASIFHVTGITPVLSESCKETVVSAMETAASHETLISFDPNIRWKLWDKDYTQDLKTLSLMSDILLLGRDEAEVLFGTRDLKELCGLVFESSKVKYLALKDGAGGAAAAIPGEMVFVPPFPCHCIDPIGAGDAFDAGFLAGVLEDQPLQTCVEYGAILGAKATETKGDVEGYLSREELLNILNSQSEIYR